ncbi:uncharacterized protein LY89DRAFT_639748 [Mollisia scopiformis]|uniref:Uncharacterized protein n=1 Tax=Mollisia scopiformis TaxID=149040 RepID=A0A194XJJ0_MOLSC|nr:uncharacterized protein LY89DRAFT_639748 [Mollisia scopiformis]KUJ20318.1 hypothetical protein LY89DRAFT_639748 [Mollisia scopiformis]
MHVQTGTATMAYSTVPLPASPTLTNPDMILPYGEYDSTPSPPRGTYRSGSPNEDWETNPATMQFSIGSSHSHMGLMTPTTPIIYGNGTMLSDIGEVTEAESTPGRKLPGPAERRMLKQQQQQNQPLRSSPTIGYDAVMKRTKTGTHQRKISIESTSTITSEAQHGELFKDFDDSASVDDSVFQGDDEESVADSYTEEVIASETKRLNQQDNNIGKDEDRNSSAALSRRAEQILLNAKKRLNNMEGNLTRARSSLYITPTGSMSSIHSSSPLSRSTPSPPQNEPRLITSLGVAPSKHRQLNTPSDSPTNSPGHSRVYSETSISSPLRPVAFPVRSASAAARYIGRSGLDASQPSPPLSYTPEGTHEESRTGSRSGFTSSLSKASPPHGTILEPLSEDDASPDFEADRASMRSALDDQLGPSGEHRGLTRSASSMQMRDLRDQMQDLKGRLSVLRDRARDDTMKRRSLQSLRTPSPFTAAEQWYAGAKNYGNSPPLSADAGVAQPPWNEPEREKDGGKERELKESAPIAPGYANSDVTSVYEDVIETHASDGMTGREPPIQEEDYDTAAEGEQPQDFEEDFVDEYNDEMVNREEADDYESDASLYHDTVATQISHEDREDAFDYEHFFLHSAMGTISQQRNGRRDSVGSYSSEDSVETTRGPTTSSTAKVNERTSLGHLRSGSTDSISTMATFATATEGNGSENGEDGNADFSVQEVTAPEVRTSTPVTAKRTTFGSAVNGASDNNQVSTQVVRRHSTGHDEQQRIVSAAHRPSVASFESFQSTGTTRSFPLVNKPKIQQPTSSDPDLRLKEHEASRLSDSTTLTEVNSSRERLEPSPVHMLAKDDQILVERLVASLGKCVLGLQEAGRGSYDGRVWRRRLDAARRVLEGQEGAV